tara:strand:- start:323 stop:505 length:183 start_codon:yes stop_codon:yes gene_type:complete
MAKAKKVPILGRNLSALLTKDDDSYLTEVSKLKEENKQLKIDNKRLLSLVEKLTQALIDK